MVRGVEAIVRPDAAALSAQEVDGMFVKMAIRDVLFLIAGTMLWRVAAPWSAGDGMRADLAGVALGAWIGLGGYLLHEWGHLAGALATRSHVEAPTRLTSGFLFSFDSRRNTLRQFLVMSFSGFAATAAVVWAFYTFLPDGLLASRVARGIVVFGAMLTVVIELPLVGYSLLGRGLPPVENGIHTARAAANGT
jgi:hypothetical protein